MIAEEILSAYNYEELQHFLTMTKKGVTTPWTQVDVEKELKRREGTRTPVPSPKEIK